MLTLGLHCCSRTGGMQFVAEEPSSSWTNTATKVKRKYLWSYLMADVMAWNMFVVTLLLVILINVVPTLATTLDHGNASQTSSSPLEASSIIFGLSKLASKEHLHEECFRDLKAIERGITAMEPWAMKVLESSGAKDSGFIWGQNYWLGSPEGCTTIQGPLQITLSSRYKRNMMDGLITQAAPFKMDYRVAHVKHNSPWQIEIKFMTERIIHIGLCLPSSCSSDEIKNLTQTFLDENVLMRTYDLQSEVLIVKDLKLKESFFQKTSLKILVAVIAFTVAMMIAARFVPGGADKRDIEKDGAVVTFIKCFDIVSNARTLFTVAENTPNSIPIINGFKSVSCFWVIIPHLVWFSNYTLNNKVFFAYYAEKLSFQYVNPSLMVVDAFFIMSGFLQTFNFIKNKQKMETIRKNSLAENVKEFRKMLFHRYLRLTPLYLIIMVVAELFTSYAQDVSMFYLHERYDEVCPKYWWRHLLFIQNLFHHEQICASWTWSLACDMQYFVLTSVLLLVYTKHPRVVKNTAVGLVLATMAWTYRVGLQNQYQIKIDVAYQTGTEMYMNPTIRVVPYLLGGIAGWWLGQNGGQFTMGKTIEKCAWSLAGSVFMTCMVITLLQESTSLEAITRFLFGRIAFGLAFCWMIIGSGSGRGLWWSRMLEHKFFQHFCRLSYSIYLLNAFVIIAVFSMTNNSSHTDPLMLFVQAFGFMVIVYLAAIVFSLAFEMPYGNWSSALFKKSRKAKTT